MSRHFRAIRRSHHYMIAFLLMTIISLTVMLYSAFMKNNRSDADYKTFTRNSTPRYKEGRNNNIIYSQEDVGYGDGSKSTPDASLSLRPFPFDPNTADSTTLLRLGLKPWQVRSIYRYRAHGGSYRSVEDFAHLPGLTLKDYNTLKPFIRIHREVMAADVIGHSNAYSDNAAPSPKNSRYPRTEKISLSDAKIDINTADTTLLKKIPGIGSYYARRIVEWRQRHRRFLDVEELMEIRNFPQSSLAYMTTGEPPAPVRINSMSLKQLQSCSLLTTAQASDIVRLRKATGRINSIGDMRNIPSFRSGELTRLAPYLLFD